jgi:hypothetical protein
MTKYEYTGNPRNESNIEIVLKDDTAYCARYRRGKYIIAAGEKQGEAITKFLIKKWRYL